MVEKTNPFAALLNAANLNIAIPIEINEVAHGAGDARTQKTPDARPTVAAASPGTALKGGSITPLLD